MRVLTGAVVITLCVVLVLIGCGTPGTTTLPYETTVTTSTTAPPTTAAAATTTSTTAPPTTAATATTNTPGASDPAGPYLGQTPPGTTPQVFAPGIVSSPDFSEYSGTFSGDGNEYYFYRFSPSTKSEILVSRLVDDAWTTPAPLPLTAAFGAGEPHITLDNRRLYFMWDRPVAAGQSGDANGFGYYVADRTTGGWSEPRYAGQGMFLTSSRDGRLYTTDMSSLSEGGKTYLARLTTQDGMFKSYERLTIPTYLGSQAHPCIAPDGSYLLFDVDGGSHLFVCFRQNDGSWSEATDLVEHGFDLRAGGAYVSPDGKYLFFALRDDIWWVDAKVIEGLRPKS
jgi:hypothetical protein